MEEEEEAKREKKKKAKKPKKDDAEETDFLPGQKHEAPPIVLHSTDRPSQDILRDTPGSKA